MKKSFILSAVLAVHLFLLSGTAFADYFHEFPKTLLIEAGQYLNVNKTGPLPANRIGLTFGTTSSCIINSLDDDDDYDEEDNKEDVEGNEKTFAPANLLDAGIFCDYKFRWWPEQTFKSSLESGINFGIAFLNTAIVHEWHIEDNSWDLCYRVGYAFEIFYGTFEREAAFYKNDGLKFECYFQAPFNRPADYDLMLGISLLISPVRP